MHGKTPPEPRRPPADEWFNSVHLWRRNRDGNGESTGRICDEARRIAANIATTKSPPGADRAGPPAGSALEASETSLAAATKS